MIYDVFISYSRRDMQVVDEICKSIQSVGLSCFTDRNNIPPGSDYVEYLRTAIRRCKIFLYIASDNSYNSQWSHYELKEFLDEQSIQDLIVYVIDDCELPVDLQKEIDEKCVRIRKTNKSEDRKEVITDSQLATQLLKISKNINLENIDDDFGTMARSSSVFISHSYSDNTIAEDIYNYLIKNGINCWIDLKNNTSESPLAHDVIKVLQSSDCLVVLYSNNVLECHDMLDVIKKTHTSNKRIIPFLIDDTPMVGPFKHYLDRKQWINAYPNYKEHLPELLHALNGDSANKPELATKKHFLANFMEYLFGSKSNNKKHDSLNNYTPQKVDYDIFISYRRVDGRDVARNVQQALKARGFKNIFFDYDSIQKGEFTKRIIDAIYSCDDFILIMSPKSMKRCVKSSDPVANEIRTALKYKKNIIPVTIDEQEVKFPRNFPQDLSEIKELQYHNHRSDSYFEHSIDELCEKLTCKKSDDNF